MTFAGKVQWVTRPSSELGPGMRAVEAHWTSDAAGNVDSWGDTHGLLDRLETVPSDNAPTNLYDLTLEDDLGVDLLGGVGADRSATVVEIAWPYRASAAADRHQEAFAACQGRLKIANAGNTKQGLAVFVILDIPT